MKDDAKPHIDTATMRAMQNQRIADPFPKILRYWNSSDSLMKVVEAM